MSDLRRLLFANQTRAYEGYPLVISRSVALRYLKQYQMYGNSEQDGTPAPENPVEVISVGDRTKNLFDITAGDWGAGYVQPNTVYTFSFTKGYATRTTIYEVSDDEESTQVWTESSSGELGPKVITFTTGPNASYIRLNSKSTTTFGNAQLEKGSTATSYVPYGYQIPVFAGGGGVVDLGTLSWTYRSDLGTGVFTTPFIGYDKEAGNINLFISGYTTVNKSGTGLNNMEACGHSTTPRIYVRNTDYTDPALLKESLQGKYIYYQRTTDASWTAPTTTPIYLNAPLRKVGNYADVLDYKNGQIIRNVGVKVLDGTEEWSSQTAGAYSLKKTSLVNPSLPADSTNLLCTHFVVVSGSAIIGNVWVGNNYINFFYDGSTEHLAEFKTWLATQYNAGTPVTMYYLLATPVTESIVAPALPTMAGSTTYTTETEVKPSNMKGVF